MLSREYLRENPDHYRQALKNRGAAVDIERFLELDVERRRAITQVEQLKAQKNAASQEIATLKKSKQDASAQIEAMKSVGEEIKTLDERVGEIERELQSLELFFPNVPYDDVPVGPDESANRLERHWGGGLTEHRRRGRAGAPVLYGRLLSDRCGDAVEQPRSQCRTAQGDADRGRTRGAVSLRLLVAAWRRFPFRRTSRGGASRSSMTRSISAATRRRCAWWTCR